MRTTNTSITKTCRACGVVNRVVIMTAGVTPRWRVGCSGCGKTIFGAPGPSAAERAAEVIRLPVAARADREVRPAAARSALSRSGHSGRAALPATVGRVGRDLAGRLRAIRVPPLAPSGASFAAACGIVLAVLALDGAPAPQTTGTGEAGSLPPEASGTVSGGALASVDVTRARQAANGADALPSVRAEGSARPAGPIYTHPPLPPSGTAAIPGVPAAAFAAAGDPGIASIIDLQRPLPAVYPDPRAGEPIEMMAERYRLEVAARDEKALDLSGSTRREVQRRLKLARHDPRSIDGIFGPLTRTAIAEWQAGAGIPATGYLDEPALSLLVEHTETDYRAWRTAERARRDRERVAAASPAPRRQADRTSGCIRQGSGQVAYGQSVRCDFKGLRESFGSVRENLAGLFVKPEPSPWAQQPGSRRPGGA